MYKSLLRSKNIVFKYPQIKITCSHIPLNQKIVMNIVMKLIELRDRIITGTEG